jgi:nitronate monooxygenase
MVAGLIHDVPTCKDLVERIVSDAEGIIKSRLSKFVA